MEYKTKGVCSMAIQYDIDDEQKVHNVKFIGGCSGNTQGSNCTPGGNPVWTQTYFMPRPACHCFKRSAFIITSPGFLSRGFLFRL